MLDLLDEAHATMENIEADHILSGGDSSRTIVMSCVLEMIRDTHALALELFCKTSQEKERVNKTH